MASHCLLPSLCLAQCCSSTRGIHNPGCSVESPGKLLEAFQCPSSPPGHLRWLGVWPRPQASGLLHLPDARLALTEVKTTDNGGGKGTSLVVGNTAETQALLKSLTLPAWPSSSGNCGIHSCGLRWGEGRACWYR